MPLTLNEVRRATHGAVSPQTGRVYVYMTKRQYEVFDALFEAEGTTLAEVVLLAGVELVILSEH